jgi:hypothetical protein
MCPFYSGDCAPVVAVTPDSTRGCVVTLGLRCVAGGYGQG